MEQRRVAKIKKTISILRQSAMLSLPVDIIVKIAFLIPNADDLFAFLEALQPFNELGPLEHLFCLDSTELCSSLWPTLRLSSSLINSAYRLSLEAILKYYGTIEVDGILNDVKWLKKHLHPTTNVEWLIESDQPPVEILVDWTCLRITRVRIDFNEEDCRLWCKSILPQLPFLTSLEVYSNYDSASDFFDFLPASKGITELQLYFQTQYWAWPDVILLTEWFCYQPVRMFKFHLGEWDGVNSTLVEAFYQAMFDCPTLEILELVNCYMDNLDFTEVALTMQRLQLVGCFVDPLKFEHFTNLLIGSKTTCFELIDDSVDGIGGIEYLMQVQPATNIKYMKLEGFLLDDPSWSNLTILIQNCTLETLTLCPQDLAVDVIPMLARAVQYNQTIREMALKGFQASIADLRLLVESTTHPSRTVKTMRIKWTLQVGEGMRPRTLRSLIELAKQRGGEFILQYPFLQLN
ncbi:hypothetical protein AeMF1_020036 [Aphanomyces euteiches]|nr:hypothetical protein AeMF1_020036 [Aphanomyces euteiches]KAH9193092.1 hypothetical protein AeNC1_004929 [Aphanomyces euteiches]